MPWFLLQDGRERICHKWHESIGSSLSSMVQASDDVMVRLILAQFEPFSTSSASFKPQTITWLLLLTQLSLYDYSVGMLPEGLHAMSQN